MQINDWTNDHVGLCRGRQTMDATIQMSDVSQLTVALLGNIKGPLYWGILDQYLNV